VGNEKIGYKDENFNNTGDGTCSRGETIHNVLYGYHLAKLGSPEGNRKVIQTVATFILLAAQSVKNSNPDVLPHHRG
jgi:hypothetical protein